jgi:hypothetical protein
MKSFLARIVILSIGGGIALALADMFLPSLRILIPIIPLISFLIGILAFKQVFLYPGKLTWKNDCGMFGSILMALGFAYLLITIFYSLSGSGGWRCNETIFRPHCL